jgi:hypothetical protein
LPQVILDNFAASMREQELDITESDFEFFKYAFRDLTCDAKPEALAFHNALWSLLASVGEEGGKDDAGQPFDAEGRPIESPLSPPVHAEWELPQQTMFRMAVNKFRPTEGERDRTDNVRGFLKELYEAEASPLTDAKEPGISFQEYWGALLETPAVFQTFTPHRMSRAEAGWDKTSCLADGSPMPFVEMADAEVDGLRGWEATRLRILELSSTVELRSGEGGGSGSTGQWDRIQEALLQEGAIGVATFTTLEYVVRTLRFRMHYTHVLEELRFHNVHPEMSVGQMGGELSERMQARVEAEGLRGGAVVLFDELLQALVNIKMGEEAMSLEEQLAREAAKRAVTGSKHERDKQVGDPARFDEGILSLCRPISLL